MMKDKPLHFGQLDDAEEQASVMLQEKLLSGPDLTLPRPFGRYKIDTDECGKQIRYVFFQAQLDQPEKLFD